MTGAGRYAPALGSDTLYERTLLEFTVHVFYESKMIFYRKACSNIKIFFQSLDTRHRDPFLTDLSS